MSPGELWMWRHPRPRDVHGRCIGQTDVRVDRRRAKRLAHRIRQTARRHDLPREVHTSSLQRCRLVGRVLRGWGWRHHVHDDLREMHFGAWDGRPWRDIARTEVDAWCGDFSGHRPGGGESLRDVASRMQRWLAGMSAGEVRLVVAHAGWMQLASQCRLGHLLPLDARHWGAPPGYGSLLRLRVDQSHQ
jgi:alpha-ribazole phosphatase